MGLMDWLQSLDLDPMKLVGDSPILQEPTPQQPQVLSPTEWLAQKQSQEQAQQQMSADMVTPEVATPATAQDEKRVLTPQEWLAQQPNRPIESPIKLEDTTNLAYKVGSALKEPASMALEALSYLDKPRAAIAGAVQAYQDDKPIVEGAKQGWEQNTSWKETFLDEYVKEHPTRAAVTGLGWDIAFDPLWLVPPAKVGSLVGKASKAIGLTDKVISPAVKAIANTETGQKVTALAEDIAGKNRVADEAFDYNSARSTDQLQADDLLQNVKSLKKEFGEDANKLTDYIEASPKATDSLLTRPAEIAEVVDMAKTGKLASAINDGIVSKHQSFNALRDAGEEIPNYLLQNQQRLAKESGQVIPDAITRDSVLNSIPNPALRKAIENLGETFISRNKANSERLKATGRLSDEQYVSYLDGEHLRRSFDQYENPDKFLEALRKNGTDEEYRRVYQALSKSKAPGSQGFGANHKVDMKDFVQRQTLSDETMGKLGLIKDPEYRIMDTLNRSSKTLREDEYLDRVATVWGKGADEAADLSRTLPKRRQYVEIPKSESYGTLAGKWLPKDVAEQVIKVTNTSASSSELVQGWQKLVSWFKVSKLANPASTMRNFYSGIPMANVFGGLPMQQMPKYMAKATMALKQGNKNPLMREVKSTGILGNVWQKQELKNIIGENPTGIKKVADWGMNAFGKPDEFWRVATYAFHRDQGKSVKEAAQIANKAMFDYSNAPEWINTMSRNGIVPFAKFPFFAGKATLKAAYENPAQLSKFVKPQNQVNNEDRNKIMPDYMKSTTLLPLWDSSRTVNGKEQPVQNNLDLSYILPFASDVKFGNPLIDAVVMSRTGKNGLGQQVIKPGMTPTEQMKEWGKFAYNAIGPSLPLPGNYAGQKLYDGYKGNVDSKGRQYDLPSAALQTLLGLKNVPISPPELFNQKITSLTNEQRNIKAIINQTTKDKSLSSKQKREKISEHQKQLSEITKQVKEANQAWKRIKQKNNY